MEPKLMEKLVAEIIARLAPRLGADGRNGSVIAVVSAATAGFSEAVQQLRNLSLAGFRLQLLFSHAADELLGSTIRAQLAGFPHITDLDTSKWLEAVQKARAVVTPLLSVNTLSKLTLLLADNPVSNVLLHALFMGKPVVMASDGVDPAGPGRKQLKFDQGRPVLQRALQERIRTAADYGCTLVSANQLSHTLIRALTLPLEPDPAPDPNRLPDKRALTIRDQVISVSKVAHAHRSGADLLISADAVVTPLAREWAAGKGVRVIRQGPTEVS
jgi:hypothetical protein